METIRGKINFIKNTASTMTAGICFGIPAVKNWILGGVGENIKR